MNKEKQYLTVTALNKYLSHIITEDQHLQNVYLKGEVSNFKEHTRGHLYFSLKDENSKINAVMFARDALKLKYKIEEGMKVLVRGRITLYEVAGSYQISIMEMQEAGIGDLYIAFAQLKERLRKEGLFASKWKKPLPKFPERIGIITAPTGAAVRDILATIKRRYPLCETILFPSLVQGQEAHLQLIKQLKRAEDYKLDLIILGRGGGSIEDLWPFNEEDLARAIFKAPFPIISAVGHEVDYTISDFVADIRAATPTGAAEIAVPNLIDVLMQIENYKIRLNKAILNQIINNQSKLNKLKDSFVLTQPLNIYQVKEQKLINLEEQLIINIKNLIVNKKHQYQQISNSFVLKKPLIIYQTKQTKLEELKAKLKLLNPMNTLDRGYAIIKKNEKVISKIKEVQVQDKVTIMLKQGLLKANILEVEGNNNE